MQTRTKGWRHAQRIRIANKQRQDKPTVGKREKNWKQLYFRSAKLHRAKQLRKDYPAKTQRQLLDENA